LAAWVARSREYRGGGVSGGGGSQIYGARERGARRIGKGDFGIENLLGEGGEKKSWPDSAWLASLLFYFFSLYSTEELMGEKLILK
jgi:hypothetical protein